MDFVSTDAFKLINFIVYLLVLIAIGTLSTIRAIKHFFNPKAKTTKLDNKINKLKEKANQLEQQLEVSKPQSKNNEIKELLKKAIELKEQGS